MKTAIAMCSVLVLFTLTIFIVHAFVPIRYDEKQDVRLNALEAASTCAQQRQECKHRFGDIIMIDTLVLKYGCTLSVPCRLVPASVP
jgi:hypothetical protein